MPPGLTGVLETHRHYVGRRPPLEPIPRMIHRTIWTIDGSTSGRRTLSENAAKKRRLGLASCSAASRLCRHRRHRTFLRFNCRRSCSGFVAVASSRICSAALHLEPPRRPPEGTIKRSWPATSRSQAWTTSRCRRRFIASSPCEWGGVACGVRKSLHTRRGWPLGHRVSARSFSGEMSQAWLHSKLARSPSQGTAGRHSRQSRGPPGSMTHLTYLIGDAGPLPL